MKIIRKILPVLIALLLSACAVIDSACLETAKTIEPGFIRTGIELSIGPDLETSAYLTKDDFDFKNGDALAGWIVPAFKMGFGIDDKSDLQLKVWGTYNGIGGRIYYKSLLHSSNPNRQSAIAPGINFIKSHSDDFDGNTEALIRTYGFEIPYINTLRTDKHFRLNWILRYGYDRVQVEGLSNSNAVDSAISTDLHRFAAIGGFSLHTQKDILSLQFNLGVEVITPLNNRFGYMPIIGMGLNIKPYNKKK